MASGLCERGICRWEPRAVDCGAAKSRKYKNAQNSAVDQNSKELFELLKYFLGSGPLKKTTKNEAKKKLFWPIFYQTAEDQTVYIFFWEP